MKRLLIFFSILGWLLLFLCSCEKGDPKQVVIEFKHHTPGYSFTFNNGRGGGVCFPQYRVFVYNKYSQRLISIDSAKFVNCSVGDTIMLDHDIRMYY